MPKKNRGQYDRSKMEKGNKTESQKRAKDAYNDRERRKRQALSKFHEACEEALNEYVREIMAISLETCSAKGSVKGSVIDPADLAQVASAQKKSESLFKVTKRKRAGDMPGLLLIPDVSGKATVPSKPRRGQLAVGEALLGALGAQKY